MDADDLYFRWDATNSNVKSAVVIGEELTMSQFAVDGYSVEEITASYVTGRRDFSPCLISIVIFSFHGRALPCGW